MKEKILKLKDIGNIFKKRLTLIVVLTLMTTIISIIFTYFIVKPVYTTTASVLIGKKNNVSESGNEYNNSDVQMYKQLMETYAEVVKSKDVINRAIENGNLNLSYKEILSSLKVATSSTNQILKLNYSSVKREEGVEVLVPLIDEVSKTTNEIISNGELFILTTPEIPTTPSFPNKKLNVAIGIISGLLLGVILSLLLEYLDDTVKDKSEIEELIGISVIGSVPMYEEKEYSRKQT